MVGAVDRYYMEMVMRGQEKVMQQLEAVSGQLGKVASSMEHLSKKTVATGRSTTALTGGMDKVGNQLNIMETATEKGVKSMHGMDAAFKQTGKSARGFSGNILNMTEGMKGVVLTGMLMSIGWQAINGVLTTVTAAMSDVAFASATVEQQMVSLEVVASNTGKSLEEVLTMINRQVDSLTDRTSVTTTTLKLLSTSLSTTQIEKFIQAVKDGSAAMGEQSNIQLPIIAAGFRRLNMNVMDNIGVNDRLDKLQQRLAKRLGVSTKVLTNAQIEQELYNVTLEQTAVFTGAYEAQLGTAKGAIERITTEWKKFAEAIDTTDLIKGIAGFFGDIVTGWRLIVEAADKNPFDEMYHNMIPAVNTLGLFTIGYKKAHAEMIEFQKEYDSFADEFTSVENLMKGHETTLRNLTYGHWELVKAEDGTVTSARMMTDEFGNLMEGFSQYQRHLKEASTDLSAWSGYQKDATRMLKELQREYENLDKVLNPEKYTDVGKAYAKVSRELKTAVQDQERAEEKLYKRVEPIIQRKNLKEEAEARANVTKLTRDEEKAKSELETEVDTLAGKIANFTYEVKAEDDAMRDGIYTMDDLNNKVADATKLKDDWTVKVESSRKAIELEREQLQIISWFYENEYEEMLDDMQKEYDDLTAKLKSATIAQTNFYNALKKTHDEQRIIIAPEETPIVTPILEIPQNAWENVEGLTMEQILRGYSNSMAIGGYVGQSGMYMLHQGERVSTALETREQNISSDHSRHISIGSGAIVINPSAGTDPQEIGRVLERYISTELLRRQAI